MTETAIEPTLAAMRNAAEAARVANHAAYAAPRDPVALYDRTGALHDLLLKTEQLADFLGKAVLATDPAALYSDAGLDPNIHRIAAAERLTRARAHVAEAQRAVNSAWSALSHLGTRS